MKKEQKIYMTDVRGCTIREGDNVLVRHPFPRVSHLQFGQVTKISEPNDAGIQFVKVGTCKKWFSNPLKLADK